MKSKRTTLISILMVLIGLSLVLYPTVSNYLKSIAQGNAISGYRDVINSLDKESYDDILSRAESYNKDLASREYIMLPFSDEEEAYYRSQVSLPGTDVMGYVVIPKINVSLPIYHGTGNDVLQNGVGHMEGSSLPIGGVGTHSVLSGHRGLPSARLFTDLDKMVIGDVFQVVVLGEVLLYEVDDITTVMPNDSDVLKIDPSADLCTLLTCTPYGVNSQRLLVRGHRIPTPVDEDGVEIIEEVALESGKLFGVDVKYILPFAGIALVIVVSILIVLLRLFMERRVYSDVGFGSRRKR